MTLSYKSGQKEDLGSYRSLSLTLVPGKVTEQIVLMSAIVWHVQDNQGIRLRQHRFGKHRSCLANLISYKKVTHFVDEGKVFHSIFLEKMCAHSLEKCTVHWVKHCLDG